MWKLLNAFSLEWSHQFSWHLFHFLTPHLQAKLWVGSVSLLFLYLIDYCYLLIIINFNQISTILFLMITIINWTKYCRHKHTIEISWTSVCTYPVIEYHCANVPSCMASHSPLFCGVCNFHLVSGNNCINLWQCTQTKSYHFPCQSLISMN